MRYFYFKLLHFDSRTNHGVKLSESGRLYREGLREAGTPLANPNSQGQTDQPTGERGKDRSGKKVTEELVEEEVGRNYKINRDIEILRESFNKHRLNQI